MHSQRTHVNKKLRKFAIGAQTPASGRPTVPQIITHNNAHMTTLKSLIALAAAIAIPMGVTAQQKLATVNVQEIFKAMPETAAAETSLAIASQKYQDEYKRLETEFNQKYADFQSIAEDHDTPSTIKERRMQEIQQNDDKIQKYIADAKADMEKRRSTLQAPIYEKIRATIATVGNEGGYTYVFDVSSTPVAYSGPDAIDITQEVKTRLGLQ